jgi:hypothetical protein
MAFVNRYGQPSNFPQDERLHRLLAADFDPRLGYFEVPMKRRHARDLRKGLFGPQGVRDVPSGDGVLEFDLPKGWTLRLRYYDTPRDFREPGDVDAEFIPPRRRRERSSLAQEAA